MASSVITALFCSALIQACLLHLVLSQNANEGATTERSLQRECDNELKLGDLPSPTTPKLADNDIKYKKLVACLYQKVGIMDANGRPVVDQLVEIINFKTGEDPKKRDELIQSMQICVEKVGLEERNPEEGAVEIHDCFMEDLRLYQIFHELLVLNSYRS